MMLVLLAQSVSYEAFGAAIVGVVSLFGGAISLLYRRIDRDAQKCTEDRANDQKERSTENRAWADRMQALHVTHAAESKAYLDRIEALYRDHRDRNETIIGKVIEIATKSEETKFATISAVTDCTKSALRVEQAVVSLTDRTVALFKELNEHSTPNLTGGR